MTILNKITFYNKTISLTFNELMALKADKFDAIHVSYIGKKIGRKKPKIFKTEVTAIADVIASAEPKKTKDGDIYWVAEYR